MFKYCLTITVTVLLELTALLEYFDLTNNCDAQLNCGLLKEGYLGSLSTPTNPPG